MGRQSRAQVAQVARERLAWAGLEADEVPITVEPVGRHRSGSRPSGDLWWRGWVDDRLPATLRGRVRVGGGAFVVVLLVALVALGGAAYGVLRGGGGGEQIVPARPLPSPSVAARSLAARPAVAPEVVVHIVGKVQQPGVFHLPSGSRVIDALAKAGGALPEVDLSQLNQARLLNDGEQLAVGVEPPPAAAGSSPGAGAVVHLNSATQQQLEQLPGVGPVTAQKILDWRKAHGSFSKIGELREVGGIGEKSYARLEPLLAL